MEQVFAGLLAGNAVFFMDGFDQAMKISSAGYPSMGVTEVEWRRFCEVPGKASLIL